MKKKVLLTTIHRPLGIDSETCTKNILAEPYNAQITLAQGVFSLRTVCNGWGLEFIASNINTPTTVLHYPTKRIFIKELKKGYDYVGIGFVVCTFPKAIELCELVRREAPDTKIVLGGYGTVLEECDQYADYVCREEGVNFLKRLIGEDRVDNFKIPLIKRPLKIMSVPSKQEVIIPTGLGCSRGCDFCCTSHFFDRRYCPLLKTGREIHEVMYSADFSKNNIMNVSFIDEDFLADRKKITEMARLNSQEIEKLILFNCFSTLQSLSQYTIEELLSMGLSGVWVGVESKKADYPKLRNIDVAQMINDLKNAGINVLISMIIGYDWHDEKTVEEDIQYLLSLKPTLSQFMLYSPCPQTPLYSKMKEENRLLDVPYRYQDGFHALFKHPHFSTEELENLIMQFFKREYEELGPAIFRVLEVQLKGYEFIKNNPNPLFRMRAREYKKICLKIYPLLKIGIKKAPSLKVKKYLKELKERVEDRFQISASERLEECVAPFLYFYTALHNRINPRPQPRSKILRYNFN